MELIKDLYESDEDESLDKRDHMWAVERDGNAESNSSGFYAFDENALSWFPFFF